MYEFQDSYHPLTAGGVLVAGYSFHVEPYHSVYEQGTKHYLFRLQTEGEATVRTSNESIRVSAGDFLMIGPDEPYEIDIAPAKSRDKHRIVGSGDYFLFCKNRWVYEWWNSKPRRNRAKISLDAGFLGIWKQLILEKQRGEDESKEILNCLLHALFLSIDRILSKPHLAQPKKPLILADKIKNFVEMHAHTSFTLEDVAQQVGISVSSIGHIFKASFGKTIMGYALEVRLGLAMDRMRSSQLTLAQIAESTGFHSYSYFHRVFRERYGIPPGEYRSKITLENGWLRK